jgi:hypothetical protein
MTRNLLILLERSGKRGIVSRRSRSRYSSGSLRVVTGFSVAPSTMDVVRITTHESQQMMYAQGILEVLTIQRVLFVLKPQPKESLQPLDEYVNRASIGTSWDTLEEEKPSAFLNQSFCTRLTHVEEGSKDVPAICLGRQPKIGNGQDIVHMQAAQQLALRVATVTIRHDLLLVKWSDRNGKTPAWAEARKKTTLLRELCVAIDVHLSSVELGGGNNALDAPEIAQRVLPNVDERPRQRNDQREDQSEHDLVPERVVKSEETAQSVHNRED